MIATLKKRIGPYILKMYDRYSGSNLYLHRARENRAAFNGAIEYARVKDPKAAIYLLSDASESFLRQFRLCIVRKANELPKDRKVAVIMALSSDQDCLEAVQYIRSNKNISYFPIHSAYPTANYFQQNNIARSALDACHHSFIEKYDQIDGENIIQALEETKALPGAYVEIGVFKGSSARVALTYIELTHMVRPVYLLDTFSGFDYMDSGEYADLSWKDSHCDMSYEEVSATLGTCPAPHALIKCNIITDELPSVINEICVCNIDVDMYDATLAAFCKVAPRVVRGGIMICEDIGHTPLTLGALVAYRDFLGTDLGRKFRAVYLKSGQAFMIRFAD